MGLVKFLLTLRIVLSQNNNAFAGRIIAIAMELRDGLRFSLFGH